jgi:toxin ParE1/3/4
MSYQVLRTAKAEEQLFGIIHYLAAQSPQTALAYVGQLEKAMDQLSEFPFSGVQPRYSTLRRQGYRVLIVEPYLLFYKVDEARKAVCLYAVMDGRREYRYLI